MKAMKISKILVGNISTDTTEEHIRDLFSKTAGAVLSISIPADAKSGKNKGYAFVEMNDLEAEKAVVDLEGMSVQGRALAISLVEKLQKKFKWYKLGMQ